MNEILSHCDICLATRNIRRNSIPVSKGFEEIYSHAVEVPANSRALYISGQIGVTREGKTLRGFRKQFEQAIANLLEVLLGAEMGLKDLVKLGFYVTRDTDLIELRKMRRRLLPVRTAVTTIVVAGLASPDLLVEVEGVAAR